MGRFKRLRTQILMGVASVVASIPISVDFSAAQTAIIPDNTLGAESSNPAQGNNLILIGGGAQRSQNLFHSFREFSLDQGYTALFVNPQGVINILARVTGSNLSRIDGTLGVWGRANLFLLNPNGVIFGPNSRLQVLGSFVATTANGAQFGNDGRFSASGDVPSTLLTVNPTALFFTAQTPQPILNQSQAGLEVRQGRSLLLLGGNLRLDGGGLLAPGGRIDLAAIAQPGSVTLSAAGDVWQLQVPQNLERGDISFTNQAIADATSNNGGFIAIHAHHLSLKNSQLLTGIRLGVGSDNSQAGDIDIQARGTVSLTEGSSISNGIGLGGIGNSGQIHLSANHLSLDQESTIQNRTLGRGNSGDIEIQAQTVSLNHASEITAGTVGQGDAGKITVHAGQDITLENNSRMSSPVTRTASGEGGEIQIRTGTLNILSGSELDVSTLGMGNAGDIAIQANQGVVVSGVSNAVASRISSTVEANASGNGGTIQISAPLIEMTEGGGITNFTLGFGNAGDIQITADTIRIDGTNGEFQSGISTISDESAVGNAGNITITANQLTLTNGGFLEALTRGLGNAGNIKLDLQDHLTMSGVNTVITASTTSNSANVFDDIAVAMGSGGSIAISASQISLSDGASISASSDGAGNGGNIKINSDTLTLDQKASITTSTQGGQGGNIEITADQRVVMTNQSVIAAEAMGEGNGGNIEITTPFLIAAGNSDIIANAVSGTGGNIAINAIGVLGLQSRDRLTPSNDISASSTFGIDGDISINNTFDLSTSLVSLPSDLVDLSSLVGQGCRRDRNASQASQFYLTGRGGLPATPADPLTAPVLLGQMGDPIEEKTSSKLLTNRPVNVHTPDLSQMPASDSDFPYVEAQGWMRNANGQVVLTASSTLLQNVGSPTVSCSGQ